MEIRDDESSTVRVDDTNPDMDDDSGTVANTGNLFKKKKKKKHGVLIRSNRRVKNRDVDAIALPLGMSMAAVFSQVMKKKDEVGEQISVEYLAMISTLPVSESLANVFGNKFEGFVQNFDKSFKSTLRTLTSINETSKKENCCSSHTNDESYTLGVSPLNIELGSTRFSMEKTEEVQEMVEPGSAHVEGNQQLACITNANRSLGPPSHSMLTTFERSVDEQVRANDLKSLEISLQLKSLRLKETKLTLDSDSNLLDRLKLSMGISKASFKAEKFKNQVEDIKHAELLKKCIDCLVAGLFIMSLSLGYGAYVHSYKRIVEATQICSPTTDWKSRWIPNPIASLNSGLQTFGCQVQVLSRMLFGLLMILVIAYLLLQRSSTSREGMPITFILLILGVACGSAGKVCVDTLGGNGYHWLLYWEGLCLLHFFSNVCTSMFFVVLHGPVVGKNKALFPYWLRRILFYAFVLLILPIHCGLMPFATHNEWKDHFLALLTNFFR